MTDEAALAVWAKYGDVEVAISDAKANGWVLKSRVNWPQGVRLVFNKKEDDDGTPV